MRKFFYIFLISLATGIIFFGFSENVKAEQFLKIISPIGEEQWQVGTTYDIVWDVSYSGQVKIELLKRIGSLKIYSLLTIENTQNKKYSWTIPLALDVGDDYQIKLSNPGNPIVPPPVTSNYFSIVGAPVPPPATQECPYGCCFNEPGYKDKLCPADQICLDHQCQVQPAGSFATVLSPNGGEEWVLETIHNITWAVSSDIEKIHIFLFKGGGKLPQKTIGFNTDAESGSYSWLIPSDIEAGNDYKIKISNTTPNGLPDDFSDSSFSILESPPFCADSSEIRPHRECVGTACQSIDSCGINTCIDNTQCAATCPTGQVRPHKKCVSTNCQSIDSCGVNACNVNTDCVAGGGVEDGENTIKIKNPLTADTFEDIVNNLIDFIFKIAIVLAPLMIIVGGFLFVTSAGDPKKTSQAKSLMIWTAVGFLILLLSKGILGIINQILEVK